MSQLLRVAATLNPRMASEKLALLFVSIPLTSIASSHTNNATNYESIEINARNKANLVAFLPFNAPVVVANANLNG